jgi:TRAP-type C4-dicarboxylate transport system permease large subunit
LGVHLTFIHWAYLVFILLIIGVMVFKRDTSLLCLIGIFILGLIGTSSIVTALAGVFNSLVYAITQLLDIILVISVIVALSQVMTKTGINDVMIRPFTKLIKNPTLAFWVIGIIMMVVSWFFWPSPAVALLGVVLLPVALRVGLPALGAAIAMNLFGHGIALSGDYIIQGAPKLTADAAGIPVSSVMSASVPLVIVMGVVTTLTAFFLLKRDMKNGKLTVTDADIKKFESEEKTKTSPLSLKSQRFFAFLIPILLILDVFGMLVFHLQGGDATALIGGTVIFILSLVAVSAHKNKGLEKITDYLIEGLQFGFKVFGPVIPIAAYFYMGDMGITHVFGNILPKGSQGIVNDLGAALANSVPVNPQVAAGTLTVVGAITGLDGSGFSGISLAGSIAHLFASAIGHGIATLTALGQIAAIYVGGGTIIPWALVPVAAICKVDAFELARRNLVPVFIGLIVTTIVAMFII